MSATKKAYAIASAANMASIITLSQISASSKQQTGLASLHRLWQLLT
jgi:hypothetical protein